MKQRLIAQIGDASLFAIDKTEDDAKAITRTNENAVMITEDKYLKFFLTFCTTHPRSALFHPY